MEGRWSQKGYAHIPVAQIIDQPGGGDKACWPTLLEPCRLAPAELSPAGLSPSGLGPSELTHDGIEGPQRGRAFN